MGLPSCWTAALLVIALALGGCSGGGDADDDGGTGSPSRPATVTAPLTGNQVSPDVADRPAVTVKVDNADPGRPIQAGLDKADVVFEEKVEGTVTRLVAVFHSEDADLVGPIRSLRTTDVGIVSAFGGVFAFADGADIALRSLRGAPVTPVLEREAQNAFVYPPGRRRPYSTYARTARLRQEAEQGARPPPPFSPFLAPGAQFRPEAPPAGSATVVFGPRTTASLEWDPAGGVWLRSTNGRPQSVEGGGRLGFTTVIVQKVAYRPVGYRDTAGNPVDEAVLTGSGEAVILSQGRQLAARWSKGSPSSMTTFTDSAGQPVALPPGRTLVMLPPIASPVTVA